VRRGWGAPRGRRRLIGSCNFRHGCGKVLEGERRWETPRR
jgi:hypothetical protein